MMLDIKKLRAWLGENLERDFASEARAEQRGEEGLELTQCCIIAKFAKEVEGIENPDCGYDNTKSGTGLVLEHEFLKYFIMNFDEYAEHNSEEPFTGRQALEALDALSISEE